GRNLLLQIDIDAAEENSIDTDVVLVGAERRVGGDEDDVFAQVQQRGRERVVVQTTSAVHAGGSRCDVGDAHKSLGRGGGSVEYAALAEPVAPSASEVLQFGYVILAANPLGFHPFEPGVEVVENVTGARLEDSTDEDIGHRADVLRILADEFADAELAAVP